jgi:HlyD family secretion protein
VVVAERTLEGGLIASGTLVPREDTAVFSDIQGYRVARVLADEGQWVSSGQPLALLDDSLLRAQIDQQTALVAQQVTNAARAQAEADRVNGLDDQGAVSTEQVEARRFAARAARAQLAASQAQLRDLQTRRAHMVLRAPYAGLVIERTVRVGDMAAGAAPWFRIARAGEIELAADVAESALNRLAPGTAANVTLADGSQVQGSVRLVSPRVDIQTKLGRVRIMLPVQSGIRAGGFARASFTGIGRPALAVPETAVRYDAAGAAVMVVDSRNRVSRVPVTTGQRGSGYVELLTGPPAGTRVVARYAAMLVPGDVIRPVLERPAPVAAQPAAGAPAPILAPRPTPRSAP